MNSLSMCLSTQPKTLVSFRSHLKTYSNLLSPVGCFSVLRTYLLNVGPYFGLVLASMAWLRLLWLDYGYCGLCWLVWLGFGYYLGAWLVEWWSVPSVRTVAGSTPPLTAT